MTPEEIKAFQAEIDLIEDEGNLWEQFKSFKPDSEDNITKKVIVLDRINAIRKEKGSPAWDKWNKEDALKKLKENQSSGGFSGTKGSFKFTPPRSSETKITETKLYHEFVKGIYESEVPQEKRKDLTIEHWRLDNLSYLDLLVQVFNGQTRQK